MKWNVDVTLKCGGTMHLKSSTVRPQSIFNLQAEIVKKLEEGLRLERTGTGQFHGSGLDPGKASKVLADVLKLAGEGDPERWTEGTISVLSLNISA